MSSSRARASPARHQASGAAETASSATAAAARGWSAIAPASITGQRRRSACAGRRGPPPARHARGHPRPPPPPPASRWGRGGWWACPGLEDGRAETEIGSCTAAHARPDATAAGPERGHAWPLSPLPLPTRPRATFHRPPVPGIAAHDTTRAAAVACSTTPAHAHTRVCASCIVAKRFKHRASDPANCAIAQVQKIVCVYKTHECAVALQNTHAHRCGSRVPRGAAPTVCAHTHTCARTRCSRSVVRAAACVLPSHLRRSTCVRCGLCSPLHAAWPARRTVSLCSPFLCRSCVALSDVARRHGRARLAPSPTRPDYCYLQRGGRRRPSATVCC